ncbi:ATP-binding protein [Spongiimicrobium salis]|uniref:ATP-binding protein n=1 Tax=Spongiimicrobium salis TaxID=1667022 RepID=UPI00374D1EB3
MKPKDLLQHVSELEKTLDSFSFEKLNSEEAAQLKKSFDLFKNMLQAKIPAKAYASSAPVHLDFDETHAPLAAETENIAVKTNGNSEESMLIAKVSHEIRTPLNGIIGFTDLLKESNLSQEQLEHVNTIQSASNSLMDIINELLEYSKLSAGIEHFESINFNFYSIIRDVMYLCNTLIVDKEVKLEIDMDTRIPEVLIGDPSKLSQVLLNLIGNAIKFVETGGICLKISLKKENKDQLWLAFDITDTGIGISEDNLKHIFDSFRQAERNTYVKYGGSGLGLSIVKQIIENLNGDIKVSSSLGIGTTFKFTLPYKKGVMAEMATETPDETFIENEKTALKGMKILVFEDNTLNQKLIEQRLKIWGCETFITDNALYGLSILEKNKIDLVLMDLRMPKMNGYEVTERIRNSKNRFVKQIPVIALTADFTIKDKDQCLANGINDYILKPYSPNELLRKIIENKNKTNMDTLHVIESTGINANEVNPKVDLAPVLEECMGELDLLDELVRLYKQNALEFMGKVKIHLKGQDMEQLEFATHKIKSGLAMMHTHSLYDIAAQMHKICKTNKDSKHLEFLYDCFLEEYEKVEKAIDQGVADLRQGK